MKVFYVINHDGRWPVGVASVVVAGSTEEARVLLDEKLVEIGLRGFKEVPYSFVELDLSERRAVVLCNGRVLAW